MERKIFKVFIYSVLFGLLMFPYVLIFIPIMILILIPAIFNNVYYIYIFLAYITVLTPGNGSHIDSYIENGKIRMD